MSDPVGKLCEGILEETTFKLRSREILVKIGKRFLAKMWRWEQCPYRMISGLSLILVNPINRLGMPTAAQWGHLLF